jgi:hypothetical protein
MKTKTRRIEMSQVISIGKGKISKAQRQEIRKIYSGEIKPILEQAKVDVTQIQNDLIYQLANLPFRKRLRFCYGILLEDRLSLFLKDLFSRPKKGGMINGTEQSPNAS